MTLDTFQLDDDLLINLAIGAMALEVIYEPLPFVPHFNYSPKVRPRFNEYACGCKEQTQETGKYYDHACANCYSSHFPRSRA